MWTGMPSKPRASKEEPGIFVLYLSGTWCHNTMTYKFQNLEFFALTLCMIHFNKDFKLELLPGWVCDPDPGAPGSIQVVFRWFSGVFQVILRPQVVFTWHSGDPHPPSWRLSRPLRPRCHNCTHCHPDQTYLPEQSEFWIPKIRTRQDRKTTEGNEESFDEDQK